MHKPRASGRVKIWRDARAQLTSIRLDSILGQQPVIQDRDSRLDLALRSNLDLGQWDSAAVEVLMLAAPPWVFARGGESNQQHLVVAGGQFLAALRRVLPPDARIPVVLINSKFQPSRILQIAATHAASLAAAAGTLSFDSLARILDDAADHEAPVVGAPDATAEYRRALGLPASGR